MEMGIKPKTTTNYWKEEEPTFKKSKPPTFEKPKKETKSSVTGVEEKL